MVKSVDPGARQPGFQFWLCPLVAVWPWISYLTSLCPRFLFCKTWTKALSFSGHALIRNLELRVHPTCSHPPGWVKDQSCLRDEASIKISKVGFGELGCSLWFIWSFSNPWGQWIWALDIEEGLKLKLCDRKSRSYSLSRRGGIWSKCEELKEKTPWSIKNGNMQDYFIS